jgi:hypothetical protein
MGKTNMKAAVAAQAAMGKKSATWAPDPGVYHGRVLEPIGKMGDNFFTGFPLHWGFGDPTPCPRRLFGGICPICQQGQRLSDDEAKRYWPGWSAYLNMLLVDEDGDPIPDAEGEAQVVVWRVGKETLDKIMNAIERVSPSVDQLVDITDSEHGIDLRIKRTGKTKDDTSWDIDCVRRGESSIEDYREAWEPKALDLTEFCPIKSADELAQLLAGNTDAFSQAQALAKPTEKKALKAPTARRAPAPVAEDPEAVHQVQEAVVVTAEGDVPAPQPESSGKAKLRELMDRKENK